MVISLNDVDIIAMPRMNIGELTEPCRLRFNVFGPIWIILVFVLTTLMKVANLH